MTDAVPAGAAVPADDAGAREASSLRPLRLADAVWTLAALLLAAGILFLMLLQDAHRSRTAAMHAQVDNALTAAMLVAETADDLEDATSRMAESLGAMFAGSVRIDLVHLSLEGWDGSTLFQVAGVDAGWTFSLERDVGRRARLSNTAVKAAHGTTLQAAAPILLPQGDRGAIRLVAEWVGTPLWREAASRLLPATLILGAVFLGVQQRLSRRVARELAGLRRLVEGGLAEPQRDASIEETAQLDRSIRVLRRELTGARLSRDEINDTLRSMSEALIVLTRGGRVKLVNRAAELLLGASAELLTGRNFDRLVRVGQAQRGQTQGDQAHGGQAQGGEALGGEAPGGGLELLRPIVNGEPLRSLQLDYRALDGEIVPVQFSAAGLHDERGQLQGFVCLASDDRERRRQQDEIWRLAYRDNVTGIPNRASFMGQLRGELARASSEPLAVLFIDLDRFKEVNDTLGHDAGDELLRQIAIRLGASLLGGAANGSRGNCPSAGVACLARLGGDEFTVLLRGGCERAIEQAVEVIVCLEAPFPILDRDVFVQPSIGIALHPEHAASGGELVKRADIAMYEAKKSGGNQFAVFDEAMARVANARLDLGSALRRALERDELRIHLQPQIALGSARVVGVEALLRWERPHEGLVPPDAFIPLAEETGLIMPIGAWVLEQAASFAADLRRTSGRDLRVAVNVSVRQLRDPGLVKVIRRALEVSALPAELLEVEVTESSSMSDPAHTRRLFTSIKEMGVGLAIDDFGTGYSNLGYLKDFAFDRLKIDRAFVRNLPGDAEDRAIIGAVTSLARHLGFATVAEGVETPDQLAFLKTQGCDEAQGFLLGRPIPLDDFAPWLQANETRIAALLDLPAAVEGETVTTRIEQSDSLVVQL